MYLNLCRVQGELRASKMSRDRIVSGEGAQKFFPLYALKVYMEGGEGNTSIFHSFHHASHR